MKATPEIIAAADAKLRKAYQTYSTMGLRWDYCCNIRETSKQIIRDELARRRVSMETFEAMGRGEREGGPF